MTKWPVIKLSASISELPLGLRVIDRREANEGESTGQTGCRHGHTESGRAREGKMPLEMRLPSSRPVKAKRG